MSRRRVLIVLAACCCMLCGSGPAHGQGQVQPLPPSTPLAYPASTPLAHGPSTSLASQQLPYDFQADTSPGGTLDMGVHVGQPGMMGDCWGWQILPQGLLYPAYLAGGRESRFASHWMYEMDTGWLWDGTLGAHVGLLRHGTHDPLRAEGWQLDVEGAAFPRLTLNFPNELVSVDFRVGVPLTHRRGPLETKFGYYHLSSHLGDEHMVYYHTLDRINYARDVIIAAIALRPNENLRLYAEAGWAFLCDGGSEPWEFQFGIDYSPARPTGVIPAPFFAVNTRIREEVDFGGNFTVQTGMQWRSDSGRLFRAGLHYFNGKTDQYQFFTEHEQQIGFGMWYDY